MKTVTAEKQRTDTALHLKCMTTAAVLAAMVTLMTAYILHIPVGVNGGYIHLGDALIYLAASVLPLPYACAVGVLGGGLADLLTAPMWVPSTMFIKAMICIPFSSKSSRIVTKRNVLALVVSGCITVVGYYLAQGILFGFTEALWVSAVGNIVQAGGSAVVFLALGTALDKMGFKKKFIQNA